MTYIIHPIDFEVSLPKVHEFVREIERITNQKVGYKSEYKNQYSLYFEFDYEDRLSLNMESTRWVINGDIGINPTLYQACRSALLNLGGKDTSSAVIPNIPKTQEEIYEYNLSERKKIKKNVIWIWSYILLPILFVLAAAISLVFWTL